jgi:hypothetical protein
MILAILTILGPNILLIFLLVMWKVDDNIK